MSGGWRNCTTHRESYYGLQRLSLRHIHKIVLLLMGANTLMRMHQTKRIAGLTPGQSIGGKMNDFYMTYEEIYSLSAFSNDLISENAELKKKSNDLILENAELKRKIRWLRWHPFKNLYRWMAGYIFEK